MKHLALWYTFLSLCILAMSHTHEWKWHWKIDIIGRMGVPNPFLMCNRSPYPFSVCDDLCVSSIGIGVLYSCFHAHIYIFSCIWFSLSSIFNRLGGDSLSLSFPFCFRLVSLSWDSPWMHCLLRGILACAASSRTLWVSVPTMHGHRNRRLRWGY